MGQNVDVVRKIEEAWNSQKLDQLDQYFSPEFKSHAAVPGTPPGLAGAKIAHQGSMQAFPDRQQTIEDIFGDGDRVFVRTRMQGTNKGGLAWAGIPANGKRVQGIESMSVYRFKDGKVVEHWGQNDVPGLMAQLGEAPSPAGRPA